MRWYTRNSSLVSISLSGFTTLSIRVMYETTTWVIQRKTYTKFEKVKPFSLSLSWDYRYLVTFARTRQNSFVTDDWSTRLKRAPEHTQSFPAWTRNSSFHRSWSCASWMRDTIFVKSCSRLFSFENLTISTWYDFHWISFYYLDRSNDFVDIFDLYSNEFLNFDCFFLRIFRIYDCASIACKVFRWTVN